MKQKSNKIGFIGVFYRKVMSWKEQVEELRKPTAGEMRRGGYEVGREEEAERKRKRLTERAGASKTSVILWGTVMRPNGRALGALGNPAAEGPGYWLRTESSRISFPSRWGMERARGKNCHSSAGTGPKYVLFTRKSCHVVSTD